MREKGTLPGELQRGWQRFWRLSWWWKGPILGVVAFFLLAIVAAIVGGGDEDKSASLVGATITASPTETPATDAVSETTAPTPTPKETAPDAASETSIATPKPTQQPTPEPIPAGPATTFGSGAHIVGTDIVAGTYRNSDSSDFCFWERLSGFSGEFDDIIANGVEDYLQIVTIESTDAGFSSARCGTWSPATGAITSSPTAPFSDGMYLVGTDIAPGTWRNSDSSDFCFWQRLSGFSGEFDQIIANGLSDAQQIVTISASDVGFQSSRCGVWTKIG